MFAKDAILRRWWRRLWLWMRRAGIRRVGLLAGGGLACALIALVMALMLLAGPGDRRASLGAATAVSGREAASPTVAAAVSATSPGPTPTRRATRTLAPTRTAAPSATARPDPVAADELIAMVVAVVDGDTIRVEIGGQAYPVRYIGIDAPERNAPCGPEAAQANAELVAGREVRLVRDRSQTDRYNRLLRYVYAGDVFVNAELIRQGYAESRRYAPDTAQLAILNAVEVEARGANVNCYALGAFGGASNAAVTVTAVTRGSAAVVGSAQAATAAPTQGVLPTQGPATSPVVGDGGYACAGGAACIKGNINGEGERIYHFPGCASYEATKIDEGKGERWFATAAEAVAAGWRRAGNCL